ncbi:MAG: UbiA family prenyltransferase [Planctomycetes bacterium]|nr:UbiA family prenyltransferase [Planctomycetota bacterium]NUQ33703.1 UbiA family prenyltransferase [Planctomycetaceae bacterium]
MTIHRTRTLPDMSLPRIVGSYIRLARVSTLPAPALATLMGGYLALRNSGVSRLPEPDQLVTLVSIACAALLLQAASNALNQICDFSIDVYAKPKRPLPMGEMGLTGAAVAAATCYACALLLAVMASDAKPETMGAFFAAGFATVIYSAPPLRLRRFDWIATLTHGLPTALMVVAGWSLWGALNVAAPWIIGGAALIFLLGATATKDFTDMDADEHFGVSSLPSKYGPDRATKIIVPFLFVPGLSVPALLLLPGGMSPAFDVTLMWILCGALMLWAFGMAVWLWNNGQTVREGKGVYQHVLMMTAAWFAGLLLAT